MMVMITRTPASVKPDSLDLPALVRSAIESIAGSLAVYVVDAGNDVFRRRGRIGRNGVRVRRIGRVLHFLPVRLHRDGILGHGAEVVLLRERLQAFGILLFVGVVVVD